MKAKKTAKKSATKQAPKKIRAMKPISKEQFEKMTPAQRRIAIAKDVLAQLALKKYKAMQGVYMGFIPTEGKSQYGDWGLSPLAFASRASGLPIIPHPDDRAAFDKLDFQKLLPKMDSCHVCGIGAAVVSAIRLFDDATVEDLTGGRFRVFLEKYFSQEQQYAIEATFEGGHGGNAEIQRLRRPADRLKAIFKNIIKNKGEFTLT